MADPLALESTSKHSTSPVSTFQTPLLSVHPRSTSLVPHPDWTLAGPPGSAAAQPDDVEALPGMGKETWNVTFSAIFQHGQENRQGA